MKSYISVVLLIFMWLGQSHAQWQKMNLPSAARVNSLAIRDSNIFAGTDGDGIFVSADNGEDWVSINNGLQSKIIHTILINGTTIFAGTGSGVATSTNNGLNWDTINSGLPGLGVWSLAVNDTLFSDTTIFAGTWRGIYNSTDNGKNWEVGGLSNTTMPVHSLVVRNRDIFAATLGGGVFLSQNGGFSWNDISIKYRDVWDGSEFISPVYSLALADTNIIASVDSGSLYYYAPHLDTPFVHIKDVPQRNGLILCFAVHNEKLFAGSSIGDIFYSNFNGLSWKNTSFPLTGHVVYSLALNNSSIFAGTESGIWRYSYPETGIHANERAPTGFALEQNYPNPFNPSTTIKYSVPSVTDAKFVSTTIVQLKVFDILGREVETLVNEEKLAGSYEVTWNAADLPSGMYFYQLKAGNPESRSGQVFTATKKMLLLK